MKRKGCSSMATEELPEVRLECFDEKSAQWIVDYVIREVPASRRGRNGVRLDGSTVIITYDNKMWPYDIASMAEAENLADDSRVAAVYACL